MKLRILHILRAPVGGLFRHVRDLSAAQAGAGHDVGVIADASSNDSLTEIRLEELNAHLTLGLHRVAMARNPALSDLIALHRIRRIVKDTTPDVVHGHGAKGGVYARLAPAGMTTFDNPGPVSFYTPHGGALHYDPASIKGRIFAEAERWMAKLTDGLIFESAFSASAYAKNVGGTPKAMKVIPNGLLPAEFDPVKTNEDATDFVFIGELRHLKGVDLILRALATLNERRTSRITATIVGEGPDADDFKAQMRTLGLDDCVTFTGALPARQAFAMGRVFIMPSRAESFPYIILEAAAAGMPLLATRVGGIPEITAGTDTELIPAEDAPALAGAMRTCLDDDFMEAQERANRLHSAIADKFTVVEMARQIEGFYVQALAHPARKQLCVPGSWPADEQA